MLIVPGPGFTRADSRAGTSNVLMSLGPVSVGLIIERLDILISNQGLGQIQFGAVVGQSGDESTESFAAGRSLIRREGGSLLFGQPALLLEQQSEGVDTFSIPVGVVVSSGPVFVIAGFFGSSVSYGIMASLVTQCPIPDDGVSLSPAGPPSLRG